MRRFLKYLFVILITGVLAFACNTTNTSKNSIKNGQDTVLVVGTSPKMYYTLDKNLGKSQLDSLIKADGLTTLDEWIPSVITYNGKRTIQYLYIKSLKYDDELIYTVTSTECDTIFKCTKRITSEK
jgi:competence protein ComGC